MAKAENFGLVDTPEALGRLGQALAGADVLAIDTEFIRERSYAPKLELVQVASRAGVIAAIDYGRLGRREGDPFVALLGDPGVLKVFHAAEQDLEVLQTLAGRLPEPFFDTQLAAGLVGYGAKPGYGALVEGVLGFRLAKGESMTDWSQRPLSEAQLTYALDDVRHLLDVYDRIRERLESMGRLTWAEHEVQKLRVSVEAQQRARQNPATLYQRVRGRGGLDARQLAALQALAMWREQEAERRDRPRGSVLKDEMLVEIARRTPRQERQLRVIRGLNPRDLDRYGGEMVAVVTEALSRPASDYPTPEPYSPPPDEATLALADLLQAVTHLIASETGVAASLLATNSDLQRLAEASRHGKFEGLSVLEGWRGGVLGERLRDVLEGRSTLGWDPGAHKLRLHASSR
jgi:ribonuclease D